VTDWSGHIDVLAVAGIIIIAQSLFNIWIYKRIKSIIRYSGSRSLNKWY